MAARDKLLAVMAWSLAGTVTILAVIAWGRDYGWHLLPFNAYLWFPVLGLTAFSLMWTHYLIGTLRDIWLVKPAVLATYYRATGWVVLALICLHPGLLTYQLFRDGRGLPPGSYEHYVAPGLGWVTLLGTASLLVFLAFEFHRVFGERKWWSYVVDAGDFAMLAIVYHSLRLGHDLMRGWFRWIWWFYALVLVLVIARKYSLRYIHHQNQQARP